MKKKRYTKPHFGACVCYVVSFKVKGSNRFYDYYVVCGSLQDFVSSIPNLDYFICSSMVSMLIPYKGFVADRVSDLDDVPFLNITEL